jgi:hypothetical protein
MAIDERKAARIILSIGSHRKERVLDPIAVAEELQELCKNIPRREVARRLKIADRTLRIYLKLLDLPEPVKELIRSRKIGQDFAYRLALLDNPKEQEALGKAILENDLTNKEVRGIVQTLRRRNPDMSIDECIQLAIKYRPRIEEQFLIITKIEPETLQRLEARSRTENIAPAELLRRIVLELIPQGTLSSARFEKGVAMLSVDKQGDLAYRNAANKMHVRDFELLDALVRKWMENHAL